MSLQLDLVHQTCHTLARLPVIIVKTVNVLLHLTLTDLTKSAPMQFEMLCTCINDKKAFFP